MRDARSKALQPSASCRQASPFRPRPGNSSVSKPPISPWAESMEIQDVHDRLRPLVGPAWQAYDDGRRALPEIVVEALLILYFGDSEAYAASPVRILTVGLNPSDQE